jgi:uncharacterized Fe-S cluster-containing MiaB family protein
MVMQIIEKGGVEIAKEHIVRMVMNKYCTLKDVADAVAELRRTEPMVKNQPKKVA